MRLYVSQVLMFQTQDEDLSDEYRAEAEKAFRQMKCDIFAFSAKKYSEVVTTLKGKTVFSYLGAMLAHSLGRDIVDPFVQLLGANQLFFFGGSREATKTIIYEMDEEKGIMKHTSRNEVEHMMVEAGLNPKHILDKIQNQAQESAEGPPVILLEGTKKIDELLQQYKHLECGQSNEMSRKFFIEAIQLFQMTPFLDEAQKTDLVNSFKHALPTKPTLTEEQKALLQEQEKKYLESLGKIKSGEAKLEKVEKIVKDEEEPKDDL